MLSSLSLHSNNKPFLKRIVTWNEKLIVYNNQQWPAQWLDWEKAPKPTCTKIKVMITVWWSAAGLIHYSFGETITSEKYAQQIDEMHQKLQHLQPALANKMVPFSSMTTPDCMSHNQCFKSWVNWATKFCLIRHIQLTSWELTTLLQASWQLFAEKTLPQSAGGRKCFPRVCQAWILHYRMKPTYFSLAKMCWLKWFLFWINKCFCS